MTREEAANILDPETTLEVYAKISYYGGFEGENVWQDAVNEACRMGAAALRELDEYKKAESEGRLVVPPCKVGSMIYRFQRYFDDATLTSKIKIKPCVVESVSTKCIITTDHVVMLFSDFGKTVFLTHEEAEKALEDA